jgi:hypothetical protein
LHGALAGGANRWRLGKEQLNGQSAIPDGAMGRAVGSLVARGEEGVDLFIGSIEGAGLPCLFLGLAAHFHDGFDERFALGFLQLGIHGETSSF